MSRNLKQVTEMAKEAEIQIHTLINNLRYHNYNDMADVMFAIALDLGQFKAIHCDAELPLECGWFSELTHEPWYNYCNIGLEPLIGDIKNYSICSIMRFRTHIAFALGAMANISSNEPAVSDLDSYLFVEQEFELLGSMQLHKAASFWMYEMFDVYCYKTDIASAVINQVYNTVTLSRERVTSAMYKLLKMAGGITVFNESDNINDVQTYVSINGNITTL